MDLDSVPHRVFRLKVIRFIFFHFGKVTHIIRKFANIYWEGCQSLFVNLLGSLPNFIGKVATIYWEGLQTLLGRLLTFIGKVVKMYREGCQT